MVLDRKTILVIDDEDDLREVTVTSLALIAGWNVLGARSAEDGIAQARLVIPDAIILDVMMPGLDGAETLSRLRKFTETAKIPVIFLTSKPRGSDQTKLTELGAAGVLSKPFDPLTLSETVSMMLGWAA
jgi:DNA-binding response OmpR family regulator